MRSGEKGKSSEYSQPLRISMLKSLKENYADVFFHLDGPVRRSTAETQNVVPDQFNKTVLMALFAMNTTLLVFVFNLALANFTAFW